MRVVIESKHVLIVEARGRVMLSAYYCLVAFWAWKLYGILSVDVTAGDVGILLASLGVGCGLAWCVAGPLADKITVTFHGSKHLVKWERMLPLNVKQERTFEYEDFTQFEVSSGFDRGFCRLRLKKGRPFLLFKISRQDNSSALDHLEMIMRKQVEVVR